MHFRLLVSRGVKGSDEMPPPQPEHCQLPGIFGRSVLDGAAIVAKPSSCAGSLARPASKGMSGTSLATVITGAEFEPSPFCFP